MTPSETGSKHLVIVVHGIRTFGGWQERLGALLKQEDPSVEVRRYKYGYFSALAFALAPVRFIETRRFRAALTALLKGSHWDRIDIVAHSFGTHIVSWALRGMKPEKRQRIHTLILAGSVLKPNFRWDELVGGSIWRLVNECGTRDAILLLSQMIPLTGMAGRVGFYGMSGDNFVNRYHRLGHSGYFLKDGRPSDTFMRENWLPLLIGSTPVRAVDERASLTAVHGLWIFILNNSEPIKLSVYALPVLALVVWMFVQWQQSIAASLAAESSALQEQEPDLALQLARHAYLVSDNEETRSALFGALQNARWIKSYLRGHVRDVAGAAFNHDGTRLVSVQQTNGRKAIVWDTESGRQVDVYPGDAPQPTGMRVVAVDGYKRVAFGSENLLLLWAADEVEIVELGTWRTVNRIAYNGDIALHPGSGKLAVLGDRGAVLSVSRPSSRDYLWPDDQFSELRFSRDGGTLIAIGPKKILLQGTTRQRFDEELRFTKLPSPIVIETGGAKKVALTDDGTLLAAIGPRLRVWDLVTRQLRHDLPTPHEWLGADLAFWPGHELLLTAGGGGSTGGHSIALWDTDTGRYLGPLLKGFKHATQMLAFSQDGRWLASGDRTGSLQLWDFKTRVNPHLGQPMKVSPDRIVALAAHPTSPTLAAATVSGKVLLFDYRSQEVAGDIANYDGRQVTALAYGGGGRKLYIAISDGSVEVWDNGQRAITASANVAHGRRLVRLEVHPRSKLLLGITDSGESLVLDADSLQRKLARRETWSPAATFHATEPRLLAPYVELFTYLSVWDVESDSQVSRFLLPGQTSGVVSRSDGQRLALLQEYDIAYVTETAVLSLPSAAVPPASHGLPAPQLPTGAVLQGHRNPPYFARFSPDGAWLATAGFYFRPTERPDPVDLERELLSRQYKYVQEVFLWNGRSGRALGKPLQIPGTSLGALEFGDRGQALLSLSGSGEVVLWDLNACNWSARAAEIAGRELTRAERERYLGHESWLYNILNWTRRVSRIGGAAASC